MFTACRDDPPHVQAGSVSYHETDLEDAIIGNSGHSEVAFTSHVPTQGAGAPCGRYGGSAVGTFPFKMSTVASEDLPEADLGEERYLATGSADGSQQPSVVDQDPQFEHGQIVPCDQKADLDNGCQPY